MTAHSAADRASVVVLIPTYNRPENLRELLAALKDQEVEPSRVVVCDNDPQSSARDVVASFEAVEYTNEPRPGVVAVRNALLRSVRSESYFAFIDDDEVPVKAWLRHLLATLQSEEVDAVGGPVAPNYKDAARVWTVRHGAHSHGNRPRGRDLKLLPSTNNCLVRTAAWRSHGAIHFNHKFGMSGGEDTDWFNRLRRSGLSLFWEPQALAFEAIPAERLLFSWFVKRSLQNGWVHGTMLLQDHTYLWVAAQGCIRILAGGLLALFSVVFRRSPMLSLRRLFAGVGFLRAIMHSVPAAYARTNT